MVKRARTEEELKKCSDFMKSKQLALISSDVWYVEDEKGEIITCGALSFIPSIEPMYSSSPYWTARMYERMIGTLETLNFKNVIVSTNNEDLKNAMIKEGFHPLNPLIQQFIKEL